MKEIAGDKLRGHLETLILATLEQGEAHGLEILRRLELRGCGLLRLKEGSLYPALYRLETSGEVQAVWEKEQHGRHVCPTTDLQAHGQRRPQAQQGRGEWQTFVETLGAILGAPA